MKTCTKCKEEKPLELFAKMSRNKDGRSAWCKACFAANAADKYKNNPDERERKQKNKAVAVQKVKLLLWEYLLSHPCVGCGNPDPRVLEFDHRDETQKSRNISEMFGWSWSAIRAEISKCDVRCANCHRIRTQEQFGTWRFGMVE